MSASLAFIPDWRADETLYSWAAGFHAIHGNGSARDTGALLFGAEHACRERDAPSKLHHFVEVTRGELGNVSSLLRLRTPIGLFAKFLPASRQQVLATRINDEHGLGWSLICSMPASGLGDSTALHYCEACVGEDLKTWGLPRWRLPHQLVGSWLCIEHHKVLKSLSVKGLHWTLPPDTYSQADRHLTLDMVAGLTRMATLARQLIGAEPLDLESIRQAVLVGLREYGITSWTHPLDKSRLASWFAHSPLATWIRASNGPWQRLASGSWIHDLLRNRVGDHPLKWMLLWCTLFADEDEEACVRRFIAPGSSPHWDACGQGTIWGASNASVPPDIKRIITEAATLKDAADSLGLTVWSLRRRLSELGTNAGEFRFDRSFDLRRKLAIDSIDNFIAEHPTCSRANVHQQCKAAVAWIRSNEPELFSQITAFIEHKKARQLQLFLQPSSENTPQTFISISKPAPS